MATLRLAWNSVKVFWWVILLAIAVLFLGILYLVKRNQKGQTKDDGTAEKTLIETVASQVAVAVTDVKVERAVIGAENKMKREGMEEIRKEPDGQKRREKLAAVLAKSL